MRGFASAFAPGSSRVLRLKAQVTAVGNVSKAEHSIALSELGRHCPPLLLQCLDGWVGESDWRIENEQATMRFVLMLCVHTGGEERERERRERGKKATATAEKDETRTLQHGCVETSAMAKQDDTLRLRTIARLDFGLGVQSPIKVSATNLYSHQGCLFYYYHFFFFFFDIVGLDWRARQARDLCVRILRFVFEFTEC